MPPTAWEALVADPQMAAFVQRCEQAGIKLRIRSVAGAIIHVVAEPEVNTEFFDEYQTVLTPTFRQQFDLQAGHIVLPARRQGPARPAGRPGAEAPDGPPAGLHAPLRPGPRVQARSRLDAQAHAAVRADRLAPARRPRHVLEQLRRQAGRGGRRQGRRGVLRAQQLAQHRPHDDVRPAAADLPGPPLLRAQHRAGRNQRPRPAARPPLRRRHPQGLRRHRP